MNVGSGGVPNYSRIAVLTGPGPGPTECTRFSLGALIRGFGDFYGFTLVAQRSADIMIEHGVHPWDVAATKVLVEEAGGRFSDWTGNPTIHTPDCLATNGKLHDDVLKILQGSEPKATGAA